MLPDFYSLDDLYSFSAVAFLLALCLARVYRTTNPTTGERLMYRAALLVAAICVPLIAYGAYWLAKTDYPGDSIIEIIVAVALLGGTAIVGRLVFGKSTEHDDAAAEAVPPGPHGHRQRPPHNR